MVPIPGVAVTHLTELEQEDVGFVRTRWRCSCGSVGPWVAESTDPRGWSAARRARKGGIHHARYEDGRLPQPDLIGQADQSSQ